MSSLIEAKSRKAGRFKTAFFLAKRIATLSRVLWGQERFDVLVSDDVRPGLLELVQVLSSLARRLRKSVPGAAERRQRRARAVMRALSQRESIRIVFVCQGNICR